MNIIDSALTVAFFINLVLSILILLNRKEGDGVLYFVFMALSGALWTFSMLLFRNIQNLSLILIPTKLLYVMGISIALNFVYFSSSFFETALVPKYRKIIFCFVSLPAIAMIWYTLFSSIIIREVVLRGAEKTVIFGPMYVLYSFLIFLYFIIGYINLLNKIKTFSKGSTERAQLLYVVVGTLISVVFGLIYDIILPYFGNFAHYWLGPVMTIVFVVSISYTIFKHHLFDIKVIATEIFTGLLLLLLLFNISNYRSVPQLILNIGILVGSTAVSIFLVRSVLWEVKTREELERLAADLSAANEQLTTLDKAKSEFIAIASHQLRTPLTAIKGYISLLMEGTYGALREKQKKPMNGVFQSAERLIRLVNDLLSISRIESGKIEAKLASTDIKKLIEGVIEELRVKVEGKGLTLNLENSHGAMPVIMADEEKIRNVLMNIIDNAIRYTSKGGITVCLNLEEAERRIRIEIKDTGEGMTQEEMGKLFESFSRGTAGQRIWTEGAGLGLYIAKKFIEMHKGRVWAESAGKGKGSEFVIELPIQ